MLTLLNKIKNKKNILLIIVILAIISAVGIYIFYSQSKLFKRIEILKDGGLVIKENLIIPDTKQIANIDGKIINSNGIYQTPLVPKNSAENIIVPKAILTLKGVYNISIKEAGKWTDDVKLVFIKSLGAVDIEGKSSQWQIVFGSKLKKKGYEIIAQGEEIVSKKEIESNLFGIELPLLWKDSGEYIKQMQQRPSFKDATISGFLFSSTPESKNIKWWFSISTSKGTVTFEVR